MAREHASHPRPPGGSALGAVGAWPSQRSVCVPRDRWHGSARSSLSGAEGSRSEKRRSDESTASQSFVADAVFVRNISLSADWADKNGNRPSCCAASSA